MERAIVPTRTSEERLSAVILWLCLVLQLTPCHLQKSLVVFHEAKAPCCLLIRLALNASVDNQNWHSTIPTDLTGTP